MTFPENSRGREKEVLEAPSEFISALKQVPKAPMFIPLTVDAAILQAAGRHLSLQRERGIRLSPLLRWVLAAAALIVLLAVIPLAVRKTGPRAVLVQGDLNHDGQID